MGLSALEKRLNYLETSIQMWLSSAELTQAVEKTIESGVDRSDVVFALRQVKEKCTADELEFWLSTSYQDDADLKNVLVLHAGNLPLVGFQDVIAVYLSGAQYRGKISKRDPWLLPSFLTILKRIDKTFKGRWSTDLDMFRDLKADHLMFAGSPDTLPKIEKQLVDKEIIAPDCKKLIRTAKFSITYLGSEPNERFHQLVEAIERYRGEGCRSVKVIVAPFSLYDHSCHLTDYFESYWTETQTNHDPEDATLHRIAYNKSIERPQMRLEHLLIEESEPENFEKDRVYWVNGGFEKISELLDQFGEQIQAVYSFSEALKALNQHLHDVKEAEDIATAQRPPIYWKPDGVDVLEWLTA